MDMGELINNVLMLLLGGGTLTGWLLFWRSESRKRKAAASVIESQARIEDTKADGEKFGFLMSAVKRLQAEILELNERIDQMNEQQREERRGYERRIANLEMESREKDATIADQGRKIAGLQRQVDSLSSQLKEKEATISELQRERRVGL